MFNSWVANKVRNMAGIVAVQSKEMAKSREPRVSMGVARRNIFLMPCLSASKPVGKAIVAPAIPPMLFTNPS